MTPIPSILRRWLFVLVFVSSLPATVAVEAVEILVAPDATWRERLAAREVKRYLYLRTGEVAAIVEAGEWPAGRSGVIAVGRTWRSTVGIPAGEGLTAGGYVVAPVPAPGGRGTNVVVSGADDVAVLHAAYGFAEGLGVRFYLHGDVVPDGRIPWRPPTEPEVQQPLFGLRGIQPFHDFPEGPDWWDRDDYLAILGQLPKLRMNFFGLHTYPEGAPNAEPTVWIGMPGDYDAAGRVLEAYPSSYQNTLRGNWGYRAKVTSAFSHGSGMLFDEDAHGPEVMRGFAPQPAHAEGNRVVFDRTAELLRVAFEQARRLGVKTCVGTETPLTVPGRVRERLAARGLDPGSFETIRMLYEGIFGRVAAAYPVDYYWFWTPEGWTWEGTKKEQVERTLADLRAAIAAHEKVRPPFRLATCGWVLGPVQDRALFDKVLPKEIAVSCINREVGKTPVDAGFREVRGRGKWAIPWLEDDPALTSPQLWVGRMRRDAADALEYGCDGLMGIHWRTRVLGPAVSALAQAAWRRVGKPAEAWREDLARRREGPPPDPKGSVRGGRAAAFPDHAIADTEEDAVYRTVRYDVASYRLPLPNGSCRVTLRFCEPHYREKGRRVFDVSLNGRRVIEALDIFERAGGDRALDLAFDGVSVTNGFLEVQFVPRVEFPSIAGLSVEAADGGIARHVDCGGPGSGRFEADLQEQGGGRDVFADTADFYRDWATAEFGAEVAPAAAAIFSKIDGHLPRPSDWVDGPGGLRPNERPWSEVSRDYGFVGELEALRGAVRGPAQTARFEWWLDTFRSMRAMGELTCRWAEHRRAFAAATNAPTANRAVVEKAMETRRDLVRVLGEVYRPLLATISNPGELGTLANWEQHIQPDVFGADEAVLARLAGGDLPAEARVPVGYRGPTRLIVPTRRTSVGATEALGIKALVLSEKPVGRLEVVVRLMGSVEESRVPTRNRARNVYEGTLMPAGPKVEVVEYYLELRMSDGETLRWPETAPEVGHTVVVEPAG